MLTYTHKMTSHWTTDVEQQYQDIWDWLPVILDKTMSQHSGTGYHATTMAELTNPS